MRTKLFTTASLLGICVAGVATAAPVADLLPDTTFFMMDSSAAATTYEKWQASPLSNMLDQDKLLEMMSEGMGDMKSELAEVLGEDSDDIKWLEMLPNGPAAVSMFSGKNSDTGFPELGLMIAMDYGNDADAEKMYNRIVKLLEKGMEEEEVRMSEESVAGRDVVAFGAPEGDEPEGDEFGEFDEFGGMGGGMGDDLVKGLESMWMVREGSQIIATSDMSALERAFELMDGGDVTLLSEREDVRVMSDATGSGDIRFMLMTRDLGPIVSSLDQMGMMMMVMPLAKQVFGDYGGAAYSANINDAGDDYVSTAKGFVYLPNGKNGVPAMFNGSVPVGDIASFVPSEAMNYSTMHMSFDPLPGMVQKVMNFAGMMGVQQGQQQEIIAMATRVAEATGNRATTWSTIERPITLESMQSVFAMEAPDGQAIDEMLGMAGAQAGMEGKDFAGGRLYEMDPSAMMPMSPMGGGMMDTEVQPTGLGIAGGQMFMGSLTAVEATMRSISDKGVSSLEDDPRLQRVIDAIGNEPVSGWGWQDRRYLAAQFEVMELQMKKAQEDMKAFFEDMEGMEGMDGVDMDDFGPGNPLADMREAGIYKPENMEKAMGDSFWFMRSVDNGYTFELKLFPPVEGE